MAQRPAPKNQFMTMLMLFACIYLGTVLLFPKDKNQDTRTSLEILTKLREFDRNLMDVSAAQLLPAYLQKIGAEKGTQKWNQDEVDRRELEGVLLVSHAKYASALYREGDLAEKSLVHKKLNDGWLLLQQKYDHLHLKPVWNETFAVATSAKLTSGTMSPSQLFDQMVVDLSVKNKGELVWGLVPGYQLIDALVSVTGKNPALSYWFAPFLLALIVRGLVYPWSMKQYRFGRQMMQLQPYVKEIQEKFKDKKTNQIPPDKQAQASAETMALYKEYGINPLAGCGSAFIQLPFFMIVFSCMQLYRFEFVKGEFFWIHPGATKFLGLSLAPNLGQIDHLLVIIYGISMIASQLMMPISDPNQVKQQRLIGFGMSIMVTFWMFTNPLPSAFTLYWVFANFLATAQALYAYKMPAPPLQKVQTVKGGVVAKPTFMEKLQNMMEQQAQQQANQGSADPKGNGKAQNGKPELPSHPELFGKSGSPRTKKKK